MSRSADQLTGTRVTVRRGVLAVSTLAALNVVVAGTATAGDQTHHPAPLVDAPFDRPRDSTDAAGLTLRIRDLNFPVSRDLAFTVRSLDNTVNRTDSGATTAVSLSSDVLFAFGKSALTPVAGSLLRTVATEITARAHGPVTITGHTDSIGTDAVNLPTPEPGQTRSARHSSPAGDRWHPPFEVTDARSGPATLPAGHDPSTGRSRSHRYRFQWRTTRSSPIATPTAEPASTPP